MQRNGSSTVTDSDLEEFTAAYLEAALWSSTDEDGEPLDSEYSVDDFSEEAARWAVKDCERFLKAHLSDIENSDMPLSQAGHDFWLTRNGHGAGFWDGDWPEPYATRLDDASKKFGESYIYVSDAGELEFG